MEARVTVTSPSAQQRITTIEAAIEVNRRLAAIQDCVSATAGAIAGSGVKQEPGTAPTPIEFTLDNLMFEMFPKLTDIESDLARLMERVGVQPQPSKEPRRA